MSCAAGICSAGLTYRLPFAVLPVRTPLNGIMGMLQLLSPMLANDADAPSERKASGACVGTGAVFGAGAAGSDDVASCSRAENEEVKSDVVEIVIESDLSTPPTAVAAGAAGLDPVCADDSSSQTVGTCNGDHRQASLYVESCFKSSKYCLPFALHQALPCVSATFLRRAHVHQFVF